MKRVLVLNANQRSTLAVTRSLGQQGVVVITSDESKASLAGSSRYSESYLQYPSPQFNPELFCTTISTICKSQHIDIVIPMTELTASLLLEYRANLPAVSLPFADIETINTLADKCALMKLAESIDIPVPQTWYVESLDKLPVDLNEVDYPLVLKPGKSWLKHNDKWIHSTVRIAENSSNAADILNSDPAYLAHPFMLQEYIPGNGGGVFALYKKGQPIAFFAHKRLREKPPRGGVSVLSEGVPLDSSLESHARQLLDHVNWHGVAMVEFRITPEGKPFLMEINTRFWGSLQLGIDSGVNFPWLLYQITAGEPVNAITNYKTGYKLNWLLGNLDWLYLTLRDSEFSILNKIIAVLSFFKPSPFKTRFEVLRWHDLRPFLWELKQYFKDIFGSR